MRRILAVLMVLGVVALGAPRIYAACGGSVPMFHSSSFFQCADSSPVSAYAWQISAPTTVNTGLVKIACEAFDGSACLGSTGTLGDGVIDIETDWADTGINGCPVNPSPARVALAVQDASGNGLIVSISGQTAEFGYQIDMAHPFDPASGTVSPLPCGPNAGKPHINSVSSSSISLSFQKPVIFSDCDPNSLGVQAFALGLTATAACTDSFNGQAGSTAVGLGPVYTSAQACGTFPNVQKAAWTASGVTPDASGNATIPLTAPPTGQCMFVGGTVTVNGVESNSITGFVQVAGPNAASPRALDVRAAKAAGNVTVTWHTDSELGLASFNVLTTNAKGSASVATQQPLGNGGGHAYSVTIPVGNFKGGKTVVVESKLADGTSIKSDPASF